MAQYKYDPMMCMNVPVKGTKAQDAAINTLLYETTMPEKDKPILRRLGLKITRENQNSMGETVLQLAGTKEQFMEALNKGYFMGFAPEIRRMKDARTVDVDSPAVEASKALAKHAESAYSSILKKIDEKIRYFTDGSNTVKKNINKFPETDQVAIKGNLDRIEKVISNLKRLK